MINNIDDLAEWFGTDLDHIDRTLYKYTGCGAWTAWDFAGFTIGSIVEGSDAEFYKRFEFPTTGEEVDRWIEELEELTDMAWNMANCGGEEDEV